MIEYLTLDLILEIHAEMIQLFGGLPGIRDLNLLYSVIDTPQLNVFGKELYPTVYDKAGVYLYSITKNHPFNDANKRTAFVATVVFLEGNNSTINFEKQDLENLILEVANGQKNRESVVAILERGTISV